MILRKESLIPYLDLNSYIKTFDKKGNMIFFYRQDSHDIRYEYDENNRLTNEYYSIVHDHEENFMSYSKIVSFRKDYKYEKRKTSIYKYVIGRQFRDEEPDQYKNPPFHEANDLVYVEVILFDDTNRIISEKAIYIDSSTILDTLYQYSSDNLSAIVKKTNGEIYSEIHYEYNDENKITRVIVSKDSTEKPFHIHSYDTQSPITESDDFIITRKFDNQNREIEKITFSKEAGLVSEKINKTYIDGHGIEILFEKYHPIDGLYGELSRIHKLPSEGDYYLWFDHYLNNEINSIKIVIREERSLITSIELINPENEQLLEERCFINEFISDDDGFFRSFTVGVQSIYYPVESLKPLFSLIFEYY